MLSLSVSEGSEIEGYELNAGRAVVTWLVAVDRLDGCDDPVAMLWSCQTPRVPRLMQYGEELAVRGGYLTATRNCRTECRIACDLAAHVFISRAMDRLKPDKRAPDVARTLLDVLAKIGIPYRVREAMTTAPVFDRIVATNLETERGARTAAALHRWLKTGPSASVVDIVNQFAEFWEATETVEREPVAV